MNESEDDEERDKTTKNVHDTCPRHSSVRMLALITATTFSSRSENVLVRNDDNSKKKKETVQGFFFSYQVEK